jgi:iron complex transport system substrate-binding protein
MTRPRHLLLIGTLVAAAILAAGCTSTAPPASTETGTATLTDMTNRTVTLDASPERVIGVGAGALRMLVYLNASEMVVAVDERDRQPMTAGAPGMPSGEDRPYLLANPGLADLPTAGRITGDPELIMARQPDAVFVTFTTAKDAQTLQEKAGVPVIALVTGDLGANRAAFYKSLRTMGEALGREERAEEVLAYINATVDDLQRRTRDIPAGERPRAYVGGVAFNGAHGFLSTDPAYAPFMLLGANNVAASTGAVGQVMIDKEKLIEWNPDVIFIDEASAALVEADLRDPVLGSLEAVKAGRVHGVMPYNWYANNYDTVLADAYFIGKTLYPEQFADVDPAQKADEIYRELDGGSAYGGMQAIFGGFGPFAGVNRG